MSNDFLFVSKGEAALTHLIEVASNDTGQSRRVANFILAWHNSEENGGWDPTDMWNIDEKLADEILAVITMLRHRRTYPADLSHELAIKKIWQTWRGGKT